MEAERFELALTPGGHLRTTAAEGAGGAWWKKTREAFGESQAAGLFALAATKPDVPLSINLAYWRNFASRFLTQLCRTPESVGQVPAVEGLTSADVSHLLLDAPPMQGGEYLTADVLAGLWSDLNGWVIQQVQAAGTLAEWLKQHAPMWQQVGRVCFHLAENKNDANFPFAFLATYAPRLSQGGRVQYQPLGKALQEYAGEKNHKALVQLLAPVQKAVEKSSLVKELVESREVFHPLAWSPQEAYRFLQEVPLLEESGVLVRLPDWWRKRPRPRVAVTIGNNKQSQFGVDSLLDFQVGIALEDEKLTPEEWKKLLAAEDGLVFLKGRWLEVDKQKLQDALDHWKQVEMAAVDGLSFIEGMRLLAGASRDLTDDALAEQTQQWSFVDAGSWLSNLLEDLRHPDRLTNGKALKGFRGQLRPYQEAGRNWLWLLSNLGLGACLADDMGLGKTIQVLSLLVSLKEGTKGTALPSLLVLPASLLTNWKAEIQKFAPTLNACYVHPAEISKADLAQLSQTAPQSLAKYDLVLTTYGMLQRQPWLFEQTWRLAILDEAQAIKTPNSRQTQAVKRLKAQARIAMTGTPVENRLGDLWSIFDYLCPGLLGSATRFKQFVKSLEKREQDRYAPLRQLVQPYILRRLKTDKSIITDLPDKTELNTYCGLAKPQAALYAKMVKELEQALDTAEGIQRRGIVLAYLMRFKQICNHPSQLTGDGQYQPSHSGKFERLKNLCEEIASRQEKVLVFTQFREMTEPLASYLTGLFGRPGLVLHGGTSLPKRRSYIDSFQREDGPPFFVLSLKAGGVGLNLTAASHVIHFDRWWNPAVENQATDRAFRIGQHRNVLVHKFVCRGTIEEKIDTLISEKQRLAGDLLEGGAETLLTEMNNADLLRLVSLDIDQANI